MTRIQHALFISPHLDDAVFSCGGLITQLVRRGVRCTLLTIFTGNAVLPVGFALRCQTDKGIDPSIDYMALRRAEDLAACQLLGIQTIHLSHLEAPHRGYDSATALFGKKRNDDHAEEDITRSLKTHMEQVLPDMVFAPYGLGDHIDHRIVRAAVQQLTEPVLWQDEPYAQRQGLLLAESVAIPLAEDIYVRKCEAVAAYTSQLGFQFGGADCIPNLIPQTEKFIDVNEKLTQLLKDDFPMLLERGITP